MWLEPGLNFYGKNEMSALVKERTKKKNYMKWTVVNAMWI